MSTVSWQRRKYPACARPCAWCQRVVEMRAGTRHCSRSCAAHGGTMAIPDETLTQRARAAGQASGRARQAKTEAKVAGMTPIDAYRLGLRVGRQTAYAHHHQRSLRHRRELHARRRGAA
jgi:hypothetical protein